MSGLSLKQIYAVGQSTARINILIGAIRSGKTFSSILVLADMIQNGPPGDIMLIGVSRGSLQRNVLGTLYQMFGWPPPPENKNVVSLYGHRVYFIGAKDERAVGSIVGATLVGAYVDEAPKIPFPVFKNLLDRCSLPNARLICTGNPEGPAHWFKKNYIDDNNLDKKIFQFYLDDNPSLTQSYIDNVKKENKGHWYKRLILGEWAAAEGMVYDCFSDDLLYEGEHDKPAYYVAGIDYGTSNATCCLLAAIYPYGFPKIRIVKEYYYDSKISNRCKTDGEFGQDLLRFLEHIPNLVSVYVDPSALSLRTELSRLNLPVEEANNDVLSGIKTVSGFFYNHQIAINRSCKNLIDSIYSYSWDEKKSLKGEDAPKKENDHAADALRYLVASRFREGQILNERESWTVDKWKKEMNDYNPMELLHGGMF